MYNFSHKSLERIKTLHKDLQILLMELIEVIDFSVLCGHRTKKEQDKAFAEGKTKLKYPDGKHNAYPSLAVDIIPYPVDWKDYKRIYFFSGIVKGIAYRLKEEGKITHSLRWGGDWDNDNDFNDQTFNDLVHWELV